MNNSIKSLVLISLLAPAFIGCHKKEESALNVATTTLPTTQAKLKILLPGQSNMADFQNLQSFRDTIRHDLSSKYATIEFVSCAQGGTSISQWINSLGSACINSLEAEGAGAILFYQGESDAMTANSNWPQDFMTLVRMFRAKYPNIPIVYAQIGDMGVPPVNYPYWHDFQELQLTIALDNKMERITGKGLPLVPEGYVDLGPDAAVPLAHRWADALKKIL